MKGSNQTKDKDKYERRVMEELHRVFTDTDSFYFCIDGAGLPADLTNTLQRHCDLPPATPRWKNIDKRFFWNKHMLKEVLLINVSLGFVLCFLLFLSVSFRLVVALALGAKVRGCLPSSQPPWSSQYQQPVVELYVQQGEQ